MSLLKQQFLSAALSLSVFLSLPASAQAKTFCNPINIDYAYCPIPDFVTNGKHRAAADPAIVLFHGTYFLFSTNQWGYWWSDDDMLNWHFVARHFLKPYHHVFDDLCAPAPFVMDDTLFVFGSTTTLDFPIWKSRNAKIDDWQEAIGAFKVAAWDPDFFCDDDGRLYLYYGSSNKYPIYGQEIDCRSFQPIGARKELINLHEDEHGWERFGEHNDDVFLKPFIEGAWMTKHDGRYYLQYGAPGTEFSGYGDGVYVGEHPLGPFVYQEHNPFSYKLGGFARGAGHGATFKDRYGNWWHVSTIVAAVKNNFERRLGLWPCGFDGNGVLYCDTAYGDYPLYLPAGQSDHARGCFTGWMLLNYNKTVSVSSTYGSHTANNAVDEDIKTYWSAATADRGEWLQSDLGADCLVRAMQINYADQDAGLMGKQAGLFHQYVISSSLNGQDWQVLVDKSQNQSDVPHDYVELAQPVKARFVKIENVHVPTGKFALSGLRVFGHGLGVPPKTVPKFSALRGHSERRSVWLKWSAVDEATGYTIRCGVEPDKLYNSIMVYGANEYDWSGMDKNKAYYFQIEAFNENGISDRSPVLEAK